MAMAKKVKPEEMEEEQVKVDVGPRTGCYFPRSCDEYRSCEKENHDTVLGFCCMGWVILVILLVFLVF